MKFVPTTNLLRGTHLLKFSENTYEYNRIIRFWIISRKYLREVFLLQLKWHACVINISSVLCITKKKRRKKSDCIILSSTGSSGHRTPARGRQIFDRKYVFFLFIVLFYDDIIKLMTVLIFFQIQWKLLLQNW